MRSIFKELNRGMGKKKKSYVCVITGCGHHSMNGARIRPSVINYLNQSSIRLYIIFSILSLSLVSKINFFLFRYKEPHLGILKIDLFNQ